jgi:GH15 family glucan-1,4-alpha-glucosidase
MSYPPIGDYGIIGNVHTAALVGEDGSIDWLCWPRFDSPSVFAAILDSQRGGLHRAGRRRRPIEAVLRPETNVLVTRFLSPDGVGQVIDFMPVGLEPFDPGYNTLIRRVQVVRGSMKFRALCEPAFDYARTAGRAEQSATGACFH